MKPFRPHQLEKPNLNHWYSVEMDGDPKQFAHNPESELFLAEYENGLFEPAIVMYFDGSFDNFRQERIVRFMFIPKPIEP